MRARRTAGFFAQVPEGGATESAKSGLSKPGRVVGEIAQSIIVDHRAVTGHQGTHSMLTHRLAQMDELESLKTLMNAAISELQKPFLNESQIASSRLIMGLDTQLVEDGTYFVVQSGKELAGCGGWSRRATLYGGDQTPGRSSAFLDPTKNPARVRAMYTHPHHVRKGVGRLILSLCEEAARAEGFTKMELMATLAGEPLYRACGYVPLERTDDARGGDPVPLLRMVKILGGQGV